MFRHNWVTVAFDKQKSYIKDRQTYDKEPKEHLITYYKCSRTGKRRVYKDGAKGDRTIQRVEMSEAAWVDYDYLLLSHDATVIDDDYAETKRRTPSYFERYDYLPMKNELDLMIDAIRTSDDFKQVKDHQMVADAMEELKTVIKLHENIDKPE